MEHIREAFESVFRSIDAKIIAEKALYCFAVIFFAIIITKVIHFLIKRAMKKDHNAGRRRITLAALLNSIVTYTVWIFAFFDLSRIIFNVNPASIFAAAGVAGVALGFGAQSIVKDIISGFFLLFEDLVSVGDYITVGGSTGTVIEIGMRTTKLKGFTGDLYVIPNGDITKLINHSRFDRGIICDIEISRWVSLDRALEVLAQLCETAQSKIPVLLDRPEMLGISKLSEEKATLCILCKTNPGDQFAAERAVLSLIREGFYASGITMPDK